jgi:hypothetical protein
MVDALPHHTILRAFMLTDEEWDFLLVRPACCTESALGYICSLAPDHAGAHEARVKALVVLHDWEG